MRKYAQLSMGKFPAANYNSYGFQRIQEILSSTKQAIPN